MINFPNKNILLFVATIITIFLGYYYYQYTNYLGEGEQCFVGGPPRVGDDSKYCKKGYHCLGPNSGLDGGEGVCIKK